MKPLRIALVAIAASVLLLAEGRAQSPGLALGLFERYVEALRLEFGVPGLSAAIIEDGKVWERGFGMADLGASIAATPSTPYPIAGLTQTIGASLVLYHCIDSGRGALNDRVIRWTPFAEPTATVGNLITHVLPNGAYQYNPDRYSTLTDVAAECVNDEFDELLAGGILDRFAMVDSVPGRDAIDDPRSRHFSASQLDRYRDALRRMALPYRLDSRKTPSRSQYGVNGVSAATGIISSVRDLAQFDAALSDAVLLSPELVGQAWTALPGQPAGLGLGLGWFVQPYNGQRVVWQFGRATDAYSSLIVKLPDRRLTLILLANSDSLTIALNPQAPDVTHSLFARTFLRLFIG